MSQDREAGGGSDVFEAKKYVILLIYMGKPELLTPCGKVQIHDEMD